MSRAMVILSKRDERERAARWCMTAPAGTRVEFREAKRTTDQNALMWALLTTVAREVTWHGLKLSPDDWKLIFLDGLKGEVRTVPNLDGNGFVSLRRSSDLSKGEMSDLIELIAAFGAAHGEEFGDQEERAA